MKARRTWRWWVLRVARGVVFVYVAYAGVMFFAQRSVLFPTWAVAKTAAPMGTYERWTHDVEGGVVEAFFLASGAPKGPALVFFHGNGERIDDWLRPMESFRRRGLHVLLVEYRGYARSGGSPSKDALVADSVAFIRRLEADPRVDPHTVIYLGRSLGGAVATAVAVEHPPSALVLQSTFSSIADMAARRGLPGFLVRDRFDTVEAIAGLHVPVLVGHGERDDLIPFEQAERVAKAAHARLEPLECRHNDCPPDWEAWVDEVVNFAAPAPSPADGGR